MGPLASSACPAPPSAPDLALLAGREVRAGARSLADLARTRRVILLIVALVLMNAADLICTTSYLTSIGMVEANPIARLMIEIGGVRQLVMFKIFTMVLSCGCIFVIRQRKGAEFAAWICTGVLFALMLHWHQYNELMGTIGPQLSAMPAHTGPYGDWIIVQ